MQNDWWTTLAERTQRYADMGDMPAFYEALNTVYGPSHRIKTPLSSSDGSTLLTDKRAHLTSGAAALGWQCHKDGRWEVAQSHLL